MGKCNLYGGYPQCLAEKTGDKTLTKGAKQMAEETTQITKSLRYRINISRGMKGSISFEATVDGEGFTQDEILERSDHLVAELEKRYPIKLEEK